MRTLIALPLLLVGLAVPASAQSATTCLGLAPTIVGSTGDDVVGTEGPDVVVTNGAGSVDTFGGDDRVCVTRRGTFSVETGAGDDQVEWVTTGYGGSIDLGAGSDTYTGGDQGSYVDAGDRADFRAGQPLGTDTIVTGAGEDRVITGSTKVFLPNTDNVRLGGGRDDAVVRGTVPATLDGAEGRDVVHVISAQRGDWTVDGASGVLTVDGVAMPPAASFADYWLGGLRWDSLDFDGGPGSELVRVSGSSGLVKNDGPFSADMGGGKDTLFVRSQDSGPFDGGAGDDVLWVEAKRTTSAGTGLRGDLSDQTLQLEGRPPTVLASIENLSVVDADRAVVVGDAGPNQLGAYGCGTVVRGGGGNDRINGGATKGCYDDDATPGLTAYGGAGDDVLRGGPSRDRLFGGPGRDRADGWYGRDQCVAEVRESCER